MWPQTALVGIFIIGMCPFSTLGEKISRADQIKKIKLKIESCAVDMLGKDNEIKAVVLK